MLATLANSCNKLMDIGCNVMEYICATKPVFAILDGQQSIGFTVILIPVERYLP